MGCSPSHQPVRKDKSKSRENIEDNVSNNNKVEPVEHKNDFDPEHPKQNDGHTAGLLSPNNEKNNDDDDGISNINIDQDTHLGGGTNNKKLSMQMDVPRSRTVSIRTDDGYDEIVESEEQATKDAEKLFTAMEGFGTEEKDLISILVPTHSSYKQLLRKIYHEKYNSELVKAVKRDTSGSLQHLLVNLLLRTDEFIMALMREYVDSRQYVEIAELLTAFSSNDILAAKSKYQETYEISFEDDVRKTLDDLVPKSLKDVVIPLCSLQREENHRELDDDVILKEADFLSQGPDEIAELLLEKSYSRSTLAAIFKHYKLKYYIDLSDSIDIEFHDDTKNFLISIVQLSEDVSHYFAKQLSQAIEKGEEKRILNILTARYNIDLRMIDKRFNELSIGGTLSEKLKQTFSESCEKAVSLLFRKHTS